MSGMGGEKEAVRPDSRQTDRQTFSAGIDGVQGGESVCEVRSGSLASAEVDGKRREQSTGGHGAKP